MSHMSGFLEADKVLRQLPNVIANRILQNATLAAARVVRKNIKADAPRSAAGDRSPSSERYGKLWKNIKVERLRSLKNKKNKKGASVNTGDAFWGRFLEFGTRRMAARPWFRSGFARSVDAANAKLKEFLVRGIERETIKLAKKHGVK